MVPDKYYAGCWLRFLACLIDCLILLTFFIILNRFIILIGITPDSHHFNVFEIKKEYPSTWFLYLLLNVMGIYNSFSILYFIKVIIALLYFAVMESSSKQATFGKIMVKIIVTDLNGERISFFKSILRNLSKYISNITIFIGYIMICFTARKQGLHDLISKCLVIRKK